MITSFSININLSSEVIIQQTYFYHFSMKGYRTVYNGTYTGMILIDMQKAFDMISHKILLDKLLPIGFSKNGIIWYESYLAECHFSEEVAKWVSKFPNISCGVLEGSILGPLLCLVYVNNMSQATECDLYLQMIYACYSSIRVSLK